MTADGRLLAKGESNVGGLGTGQKGAWSTGENSVSVNVPGKVKFQSVKTGNNHVIALTTDGKVYAWGDNSSGQVGIDDLRKEEYQDKEKDRTYVFKPVLVFPTANDPTDLKVIQI